MPLSASPPVLLTVMVIITAQPGTAADRKGRRGDYGRMKSEMSLLMSRF